MTKPLTQEQVRAFALSLPEAHESSHHGTPDLRVRNKIFATLPAGGETVNVKIAPENLDALRRTDPHAFRDAWAGRWMRADLERVDAEMVKELVVDAWCLVAPKSIVRAYMATRASGPSA